MTREECTKRNHESPYRTKLWKLIMREIEFRGYDESSGLWRYGFLLFDGRLTYIAQIIQGKIVRWHVNPNTVGQFTGLLDKNGKEIYEGDIIKHPYVDPIFRDLVEPKEGDGVTSEVVFHDGAFVVKYDENDFIYLDAFTRHGYVEVIGNIHENSELVKYK